MTAILTWNIQYGKGCDGVTDLRRIADVARALGDADVLCFQEVSRNDPDIAGGADQAAILAGLFLGYEAAFGPSHSKKEPRAEQRREFGNLILSRLPVLQAFRHHLPRPAEAGIKHMQRQATEVVVQTQAGALRVVTTHLEFFSARHRAAQIARLHELQAEAAANEAAPANAAKAPYDPV